jgi:hypothetical protein
MQHISSAHGRALQRIPDPFESLKLRAWARAYLWSIGEYDLHQAVDELQVS